MKQPATEKSWNDSGKRSRSCPARSRSRSSFERSKDCRKRKSRRFCVSARRPLKHGSTEHVGSWRPFERARMTSGVTTAHKVASKNQSTAERRLGKERVIKCKSRGGPYH